MNEKADFNVKKVRTCDVPNSKNNQHDNNQYDN